MLYISHLDIISSIYDVHGLYANPSPFLHKELEYLSILISIGSQMYLWWILNDISKPIDEKDIYIRLHTNFLWVI